MAEKRRKKNEREGKGKGKDMIYSSPSERLCKGFDDKILVGCRILDKRIEKFVTSTVFFGG